MNAFKWNSIRNGNSHPIFGSVTGIRINEAEDIFVGDHMLIETDAKIPKGVRISDNAIIGVGSIVTGRIEFDLCRDTGKKDPWKYRLEKRTKSLINV